MDCATVCCCPCLFIGHLRLSFKQYKINREIRNLRNKGHTCIKVLCMYPSTYSWCCKKVCTGSKKVENNVVEENELPHRIIYIGYPNEEDLNVKNELL